MLPFLRRRTHDEVVEDVEITFSRRNSSNSVPLQVIVEGFDPAQPTMVGELWSNVFSGVRGVVVKERPSVSKGLDDKFSGRNLVGELESFLA